MYSIFESEIAIRPDDIDINNHVHSSRYMDYVLAARYDQMENNYKMSMGEFLGRGLTWVISDVHLTFKRELKLEDKSVLVRTHIAEVTAAQAKVNFQILKKSTGKEAAAGYFLYTLISTANGRPVRIPPDIVEKYSV